MGEKKAPRLTPEQNEARQAARAEKREQARDVHTLALITTQIYVINKGNIVHAVDMGVAIMRQARANAHLVRKQ